MNVRTALPLTAALVVAAGALAPALAAPPKPITESWSMQHVPVPLPVTSGVGGSNSCQQPDLEGVHQTTKTFKTVGAGTLEVVVSGFAGDWDITITDGTGKVLGVGSGTSTADPSSAGTDLTEKAVIKTKKAMTINVHACNFGGGPTADGKYTFTYSG